MLELYIFYKKYIHKHDREKPHRGQKRITPQLRPQQHQIIHESIPECFGRRQDAKPCVQWSPPRSDGSPAGILPGG